MLLVSNPEDSKITTVQDDVECNVSDEVCKIYNCVRFSYCMIDS